MAIKPKIFVFSTAYHPFIGGAEIAIQEVSRRLAHRFDFLILTSRFRRDLPKKEIRPEGTIIRFGFGTPFDKFLLIPFSFFYVVWNLLARRSLGGGGGFGAWNFPQQNSSRILLWGMDIGQGSLAASLVKLFFPRVPFILTMQYGEAGEYLERGRLGAIKFCFKFMLRRANGVTAISTYLLDFVRRYGYMGPGEVIHNGVDVQKFTKHKTQSTNKTQNTKHKTIITVSRLVRKNGIDTLIKSVAEVKKEFSDIRCHIIGDGPEKISYQLLVTNNQLDDNVIFFGSVPYDEIPRYLHEADIFVRPSRSEGLGNSFVEALAAGLPIIGTPVGGITDIIEDPSTGSGQATGFFAKPDDADDLAKKIIYVLRHSDEARQSVENGRKIISEKFSWDNIAPKYFCVFRGETPIAPTIGVSPLRILIATPLLPPQLGGPAIYAANLTEKFKLFGHRVKIVSFEKFLKYPSGIRHLLYFFSLLRHALHSQIIFALDYTSVGLPAACVSVLLRKPLVIRAEGDFLWESYVERTRMDITLEEFYRNPPHLSKKDKFVKAISGRVMRHADWLVFSSEWRREMIIRTFGVDHKKTLIIRNVWSAQAVTSNQLPVTKVILWAGRMLYLKNLYRLLRAFSLANAGDYELRLVGDGPERQNLEKFILENRIKNVILSSSAGHAKFMAVMKSAAFFVLPSFSDVGPNVIAEAYSCGVPFLMTRHSGYTEYIKDSSFWVDPWQEEELVQKLKWLMDEKNRIIQKEKMLKINLMHSWEEAAREWSALFRGLCEIKKNV